MMFTNSDTTSACGATSTKTFDMSLFSNQNDIHISNKNSRTVIDTMRCNCGDYDNESNSNHNPFNTYGNNETGESTHSQTDAVNIWF